MKRIFILCVSLLYLQPGNGQLYIAPGAQIYARGSNLLTLNNCSFLNQGNFFPGLGTLLFTGSANSVFGGSQSTAVHKLEINKTGGAGLVMQQVINATDTVLFTSGHIDLNGQILDLGTTARLVGEKESSRITGLGGGYVVVSAVLNGPVNANPGNLGAEISSGSNMGNVLIRRGHRSQNNSYGLGYSVHRYYDILPANNNNLDATFRFSYFNSELNGIPENSLFFWSSADNLHWTSENVTSRDATLNYLEKQGINTFRTRWTLSDAGNPLPVNFTSFNFQCVEGGVLLTWQTAREQHSDHFRIERSFNSTDWITVGRTSAAGNSNSSKSYSFLDRQRVEGSYYRIAEADKDGRETFTGIIHVACSGNQPILVWPNPFSDRINIKVILPKASSRVISVRDNTGKLLKSETHSLPAGVNQLLVETSDLPKAVYWITVYNVTDKEGKTFRLIKQ